MEDNLFTVGDKTQFGEISGFYVCQDKEDIDYGKMMVCFKEVRANRNLNELQKVKPILFTKRPPLGLMPFMIHSEQRLYDINEAIKRYLDANMVIPNEWIAERETIVARLKS